MIQARKIDSHGADIADGWMIRWLSQKRVNRVAGLEDVLYDIAPSRSRSKIALSPICLHCD
jgi:hypothetical protein